MLTKIKIFPVARRDYCHKIRQVVTLTLVCVPCPRSTFAYATL